MIDRFASSDLRSLQTCIASRRPCILSLPDELKGLQELADLQRLSDAAGAVLVSVEPLSQDGRYGTGAAKQQMTFAALLKALQNGEQLYMTTQYGQDEDAVLAEPLTSLQEHVPFPLTLEAAHGLVTAKINLWLGASEEAKSSGCHHDFHDNFYCLLAGNKTFRLFAPTIDNIDRLKLHGSFTELYENGLITYDEQLGSDGMTALARAQIKLALREEELQACKSGSKEYAKAEAALEEATDEMLRQSLHSGAEAGDGESDMEQENEDDDEADPLNLVEDLADGQLSELSASRSETSEASEASETEEDTTPPSFSTLSSAQVSALVQEHGEQITLTAGELLYLPASWFHEVLSHSGTSDFHMAVNYWFYPPDGPEGTYLDAEVMNELRRRNTEPDKSSKRRKLV